jgi:PBP1b-binding outer membrane lipoprotein LpoB
MPKHIAIAAIVLTAVFLSGCSQWGQFTQRVPPTQNCAPNYPTWYVYSGACYPLWDFM